MGAAGSGVDGGRHVGVEGTMGTASFFSLYEEEMEKTRFEQKITIALAGSLPAL